MLVHLLTDSVQTGATALYVAAQNGPVEVLIGAEAQVDIQDKVSFTACLFNYWMCTEWDDCIAHCQSAGSLSSCWSVVGGQG